MIQTPTFLRIFLILQLVGCGWNQKPDFSAYESELENPTISSIPEPTPEAPATAKTTTVKVQEFKRPPAPTPSPEINGDVQIIWAIPAEPVQGFVLHYGSDKSALTNEVVIEEKDLKRTTHPKFGEVYRHILPNVPSNQKVFVGISAYTKEGISEMSEVFEAN